MTRTTNRRGRKAVALCAVGAVLGVGIYTTLASWNDNEWVVAGLDGDGDDDGGVGTSTFEVVQNREQAPAVSAAFEHRPTNLEAGPLEFDAVISAMSPGQTVYAPVALKTTDDSIAGEVTLQGAVASEAVTATDPNGLLWDALRYTVRTSETALDCDADSWADWTTTVVADASLGTGATAAQSLPAAGARAQYYCFAITLPAEEDLDLPVGAKVNDLQGRAVYPAWNFASESVD